MKKTLIDRPSQKITNGSTSQCVAWWILELLPGIILFSAIDLSHSFNLNSMVIWSLIACFFAYLAWITTVFLVGVKNLFKKSKKFKSYSEPKRNAFKWIVIAACVGFDIMLPMDLPWIVSWLSIGIIILLEIGLTTAIYHKINLNALFKGDD